MRAAAFCALIALGACGSGPEKSAPAHSIVLSKNAILVGETGLEIGFGRDRDGAIAAMARLLESAPDGAMAIPACGEIVTWPGGLSMTFVNGDFRGWSAPAANFRSNVSASGARVSSGHNCSA